MDIYTCTKCGEARPADGFSTRGNGQRQSWCKACTNEYAKQRYADNPNRRKAVKQRSADWAKANREKRNAQARARRARLKAEDPEGYRERNRVNELAYRYGITPADYKALLAEQDGVCAICKSGPRGGRKHLVVDHCHDTGTVRGLLCNPCNTGLGHFGDDPDRLAKAITYLG